MNIAVVHHSICVLCFLVYNRPILRRITHFDFFHIFLLYFFYFRSHDIVVNYKQLNKATLITELARRMLAGADKFDTRVWAVAVGIVMGTLVLLGLGTCFLLYQECRLPNGKSYI